MTTQAVLFEATAPVELNLRMPGQYFDSETGEFYNYFRQYDPRTGRYTQADPIEIDGGWNRQAYVDGNPLSVTDSQGLQGRGTVTPGGPGANRDNNTEWNANDL